MKKRYIVLFSCLLSSSLIAQNFEEITGTPFEGVAYGSIAFADVDNDGDQDVIITGRSNNSWSISKLYTNNGSGVFTEVLDTPFVGVSSSSIAFADIDNDADQDVLITGLMPYPRSWDVPISKLYINDSNGIFTEVLDTPFYNVAHSSIAFVDIDNDNNQDVLLTGSGVAIPYITDENGNFTEVFDTPFEGVNYSSIAFADVDNDNDQDVIITGDTTWSYPYENATLLYTNDENGNFELDTLSTFHKVRDGSIAFADVDNDSYQDVLITGSGVAILYTNDQNGNFEEVENTPFDGVSSSSIAFSDYDNDGDQDVLITGSTGNYPDNPIAKLYTNLYGTFIEEPDTPFDGVYKSSIAFADIDDDGDEDVLITGENIYGEFIAKLYRNLTVVGINENTLFSSVSIFPNPNTGLINIDLGSLSDVSIKVLNLRGQLVYAKENINTPLFQFELSAAPGVYILELSAEGEKQQFKLIKN